MRLHYLQHVPFEDLATIAVWAAARGCQVTRTRLYRGEAVPAIDDLDMLVVLGGPMNVDEHDAYPWLVAEKRFIGQAVDQGKTVLGICLGAQLIARVLGAKVVPNPQREIGWFPVSLTDDGRQSRIFSGFPNEFVVFHWHGDTFDIPAGAFRLAKSHACSNQAFQYADRVLALQFHLEYSEDSIPRMVEHCGADMISGPCVQRPDEILGRREVLSECHEYLIPILDRLAESARR